MGRKKAAAEPEVETATNNEMDVTDQRLAEQRSEMTGVLLLGLSLLSLVAVYFEKAGFVGEILKRGFHYICGRRGAIISIVLVGMCGLLLISQRKSNRPVRHFSAVGSLFLWALVLMHFWSGVDITPNNWEAAVEGSGVIGHFFALRMTDWFGPWGTVIVMLVWLVITAILALDRPLLEVLFKIRLKRIDSSTAKKSEEEPPAPALENTENKGKTGAFSFSALKTPEEPKPVDTPKPLPTLYPQPPVLTPIITEKDKLEKQRRNEITVNPPVLPVTTKASLPAPVNASLPGPAALEPPPVTVSTKVTTSPSSSREVTVTEPEKPNPMVRTLRDILKEKDKEKEKVVIEPQVYRKMEEEKPKETTPVETIQPEVTHGSYTLPGIHLIGNEGTYRKKSNQFLDQSRQLEETLAHFGIQAKVIEVHYGPVITRYDLQPAPGVKVSRIVNLADDLALALAAKGLRLEAPIPGKSAIGIEVPNYETQVVTFRDLLEAKTFWSSGKLCIGLGVDIGGEVVIADLRRMPHLLVAGATGSGKSVCVNTLIMSILFKAFPHEVKFIMIDPKMVELSMYNGIPHLLAPVVTEAKKAAGALKLVVDEMERRYRLFAEARVRDLDKYNSLLPESEALPVIVVLIDELADLMMVAPVEVEDAICRLAQMARATGIHLVVATQRPSVDVITGLIKANIPSRIAFAVSSQVDSRTILDSTGAERLLGRGDMLFAPVGSMKPRRVQGALVTEAEIETVIKHWKSQGEPEYQEQFLNIPDRKDSGGEDEDDLFWDAVRIVVEYGQASASVLQRRLRIGYARAARLVDMMEARGMVGPYEGSKPREVYITARQMEELKRRSEELSL